MRSRGRRSGELPNLSLEDALRLVHLCAERGSPKYEKAAMRSLERYLAEGSPRLQHFAEITASLAKLGDCGLRVGVVHMWPRRRTKPGAPDLSTPEDRLWREIGFLFEDESGYYAGPDVGLWELAPNDVERVWAHFEACCTSFPDEPLSWTPDDTEYQPSKLPGAVGLVLAGRLEGIDMRLSRVRSQGDVLPDLFVSVHRDGFMLYWWVGHPEDEWTPKRVAALVVLLAELRELVPHALLEFEWPSEAPGFWDIVANYRV